MRPVAISAHGPIDKWQSLLHSQMFLSVPQGLLDILFGASPGLLKLCLGRNVSPENTEWLGRLIPQERAVCMCGSGSGPGSRFLTV